MQRKLKINRKIKTVNDLLARSDVNETLSEISALKSDIVKVLVIYETADEFINYKVSGESADVVETLGMIEYAKDMILHPDSEDKDES